MTNVTDMGDENAPNLEQLLQIAETTLRQGNKDGARVLIQQVLDQDKRNDRAWVLFAAATDDPTDRRRYLRTALHVNPNNQAAQRALAKMKKARTRSENQALYYGMIGLVAALLIAAVACVIIFVI